MPDWKKEISARLKPSRLAPTREAEIVEELALYLEDRYEELLAGGMNEAEARGQTLAELSENHLLAEEIDKIERPLPRNPWFGEPARATCYLTFGATWTSEYESSSKAKCSP